MTQYAIAFIKFFGHIFTDAGIKADPEKVAAITKIQYSHRHVTKYNFSDF